MKLEFSRQIFGGKKGSNIKFHQNPSSQSRVVPCGRTDEQTNMTKLIVAFSNSANGPKTRCGHTVFPVDAFVGTTKHRLKKCTLLNTANFKKMPNTQFDEHQSSETPVPSGQKAGRTRGIPKSITYVFLPLNTGRFICMLVSKTSCVTDRYSEWKIQFKQRISRRNCLLKRIIEGKIQGQIEMTRRRGRRRMKLLDDLGDRRGYPHLKEEALDRIKWRNRFGRGCGPVVWQITDDIPSMR
jgi:hypothetical protein